ncbi:MAG: phosphoglucosamine mutase [Planctomycetota bacterium]|nr:phosphoglucosamine mutase [Planctomycetota bacterium]
MIESSSSEAPLMLSVSGMRGIVGQTMTSEVAEAYAGAFGSYIRSTGVLAPTICLGRDSRPSGAELMQAASMGLRSVGCRVIELGVVATPTVGVEILTSQAEGGMVITASHNPTPWNGIKCLNADGVAPPPDMAGQIIERFKAKQIDLVLEGAEGDVLVDDGANERHLKRVLKCVDAESICDASIKVVLDSVNGAGCESGFMLLKALGCEVVHLNGEPTGLFAHTPEPTEANLTDLAARTKVERAAIGFAQDPDADRLAVVDEHGSYIGEEYTMVLAAKCVLDQTSGGGVIAANLSTSRMIDDLAARYEGVRVVRTKVGEAHVVEALKASGKEALLGGEGNGGVILPGVCWVRDSLGAMALTLSLLANENKPLSEIVASLPKYTMIKQKFDLSDVGGLDAVAGMIQTLKETYADADQNDSDGIRLDFSDGWVHLRPSNTEPIVRLIGEAKDEERAWELINEVVGVVGLR